MNTYSFSCILIFYNLLALVLGLEVTPGSPCAVHCLDSPSGNEYDWRDSTTESADIVCSDANYTNTNVGVKFKKCLECLQESTKTSQSESDLRWFIYNLRFSLSTCLFDSPNSTPFRSLVSPCAASNACQSLKIPLSGDQMKPLPENTWNYCTASDGAFEGSQFSACSICLRASGNQVYLSNFLIALKAGCEQNTEDEAILELNQTIFTTSADGITDPSTHLDNSTESPKLAPAVIAGIAVGVGLLFLLAFALFTIHLRREKAMNRLCNRYYYGENSENPGSTGFPTDFGRPSSKRYKYISTKQSNFASVIEDESDTMDDSITPKLTSPYLGTAHPAYISPVNPRGSGRTVVEFSKSLPEHSPTYNKTRSTTPDSFAVQAYLTAAEDSARLARPDSQSTVRQKLLETVVPPLFFSSETNSPRIVIPSLVKPTLARLRGSRKNHQTKSKSHTVAAKGEQMYEMQISDPVMRSEERFCDRPLGGGVILATERPHTPEVQKYVEYTEVPLRSGKSALYGF